MTVYYEPDCEEGCAACGKAAVVWCDVCGGYACQDCEELHAEGGCKS